MKKTTRNGFIQLAAVIFFVFLMLGISRRMVITFEPQTAEAKTEKALFATTMEVTPAPYQLVFETTGTVEAITEIEVVPEVSGRVMKVHPDFYIGGHFKADEVLFEIEPLDYELEVERARSQVSQAATQLELEEAEKGAALIEWKQINGDKELPSLVARVPQIQEAEANLKAAEAQLAASELALSRTKFTLPKDGRILSSQISEGQYLRSGQAYGNVYYTASLEVSASLHGQQLDWLYQSENPRIEIEATFQGKTQSYAAVLERGAASLNTATRFATVRFAFIEESIDLIPGVFCKIKIYGPTVEQMIRIPISSLQSDGSLWLVDDENRLMAHQADVYFAENEYVVLRGFDGPVTLVTSSLPGAMPGTLIFSEQQAGGE